MKSLGFVSMLLLCLMPFQNCGQGFKSTSLDAPTQLDTGLDTVTPEQLAIDPYYGEPSGPQAWSAKPTLDVGVTAGVTPLSQLAFNQQGLYAAALSGPQIAFYKSSDRGAIWELPNGQLRSAGTNRAFRFLKLFGTHSNRIYMSTFSSRVTNPTQDRQFDLEFTEDGGNLWSRIQTGHGEVWDLIEDGNQIHALATPIQLDSGAQGQIVAPCAYLNGSRNSALVAIDKVGVAENNFVAVEARCGKLFVRGNRIVYSYTLRRTRQTSEVVVSSHLRVSNDGGQTWSITDLDQLLGGYGEWTVARDRFGTMIATSYSTAVMTRPPSLMKVSFDFGQSWTDIQGEGVDQISEGSLTASDYQGNIYLMTSKDVGANMPVSRSTCQISVPENLPPETPLECEPYDSMDGDSDHGYAQDMMVVGKRVFWIGLTGKSNARTEFTIKRFY